MAGNDTMPIRIPISMDSQQVDADASKAAASFNRMRTALRSIKADVTDTGKSYEQLGREQEQLEASKAKLTKQLETLRAAYDEHEKSVNRDAEAQAKLYVQINGIENQLRRVDAELGKNSLAQYTTQVTQLDAEINKLSRQTETEVAQLRIAGNETEAANRAREGAARMAQLQSQRVDLLREATAKATAAEGEGSKVVADLSAKYNTAANELQKLNVELGKSTAETKAQGDAMKTTSGQTSDYTAQILGIEVSTKRLGDSLTNNVSRPLLQIGEDALSAAIETQAMEQSFDSVFKKSSAGARAWSQDVSDSMTVSEFRLREMMTSSQILFGSLEVDAQKSGTMIQEILPRLYDLAALMDSDVATAFEKYQAGLVGSSKPLREWGIVLTENSVKEYAWKNGIAATGVELTEQQKVLARHSMIMQQTAQAQGRWNLEADTTSGRLKTNSERWDEMQRKLGEVLLPVLDKLLGIIEPIVDWLGRMDTASFGVVAAIMAVVAAVGPVLQMFSFFKALQVAQMVTQAGGALTGMGAASSAASPKLWQIVAVILAIAAAIALVIAAIALLTGQQARYQEAMNDANRASEQAASRVTASANKVGKNARGTSYWRGGPTEIDEDGPEVIDLPQGTRIYPADRSRRMMGGGGGGGNVFILEVAWEQVRDVVHLVDTARSAERLARQGV